MFAPAAVRCSPPARSHTSAAFHTNPDGFGGGVQQLVPVLTPWLRCLAAWHALATDMATERIRKVGHVALFENSTVSDGRDCDSKILQSNPLVPTVLYGTLPKHPEIGAQQFAARNVVVVASPNVWEFANEFGNRLRVNPRP